MTDDINAILTRAAKHLAPHQQDSSTASIFDRAAQQFPILKNAGITGVVNHGGGNGYLEFWPPNETGTQDQPRPSQLPMNQPGVEIYSDKTRPIDVLGDVVSHWLVNEDPTLSSYYDQFVSSMTPRQQQILKEQYQYAQQHLNERRPFSDWAQASGIPAYFRGYAFKQWPDAADLYTPDQRAMFDDMMRYLTNSTAP